MGPRTNSPRWDFWVQVPLRPEGTHVPEAEPGDLQLSLQRVIWGRPDITQQDKSSEAS